MIEVILKEPVETLGLRKTFPSRYLKFRPGQTSLRGASPHPVMRR